MVAVIDRFSVMTGYRESEWQAMTAEEQQKAVSHALADELYKEGLISINVLEAPDDAQTGEKRVAVFGDIFVKTKDSEVLHTGKTKFVKD